MSSVVEAMTVLPGYEVYVDGAWWLVLRSRVTDGASFISVQRVPIEGNRDCKLIQGPARGQLIVRRGCSGA